MSQRWIVTTENKVPEDNDHFIMPPAPNASYGRPTDAYSVQSVGTPFTMPEDVIVDVRPDNVLALGKVANALAFLASCVKSGEQWTTHCEEAMEDARHALVELGLKRSDTVLIEIPLDEDWPLSLAVGAVSNWMESHPDDEVEVWWVSRPTIQAAITLKARDVADA